MSGTHDEITIEGKFVTLNLTHLSTKNASMYFEINKYVNIIFIIFLNFIKAQILITDD